jgi:hypothetical protein
MILHRYRHRPARGHRRPTKAGELPSVMVSTRLEPDEFERLASIAAEERRPVASVVREAVRDFLLRGPTYRGDSPRALALWFVACGGAVWLAETLLARV